MDSVYDVLARDFPRYHGLRGFLTMAAVPNTPVSSLSTAERELVRDALDMYEKSLARAEKAAKDSTVASAYKQAAARVRALSARVVSGELAL